MFVRTTEPHNSYSSTYKIHSSPTRQTAYAGPTKFENAREIPVMSPVLDHQISMGVWLEAKEVVH
ncbi:hypothetical protein CY34DRAFT_812828 [Suillus luteus UH-Slu-Lm8-n1]|uniref:Uncharacterized protein n=1 Tax=Suillus luteus UH-Slu-Lm8-n1 TaxID=930992 RepID=A0A0D0AJX3_9AGAM|nr:hypothetical protein CY34DRAFT_812828 [Suillus luteus UH-Slu-Lm8-n1]